MNRIFAYFKEKKRKFWPEKPDVMEGRLNREEMRQCVEFNNKANRLLVWVWRFILIYCLIGLFGFSLTAIGVIPTPFDGALIETGKSAFSARIIWRLYLYLGLLFAGFSAFTHFIFGVRPQDDNLARMNSTLAWEIEELQIRLKRREELESEYHKEKAALEALEDKVKAGEITRGDKSYLDQKVSMERARRLFHEFNERAIRPRKRNGERLQRLNENDQFVEVDEGYEVYGLNSLKKVMQTSEKNLVKRCYMPSIVSLFLMFVFLIFAVTMSLDHSIWFRSSAVIITVLLLMYLLQKKSWTMVEQTEVGLKFFLGKPYQQVSRGRRFSPRWLVKITNFPTTVQYYNVDRDPAMITGPDSQRVTVNISIPWYIRNIWDVITSVGDSMPHVVKKMQGDPDDKDDRGMIGDRIINVERAFVADQNNIRDLDDALRMRKDLASEITDELVEDFGHLGIGFGNPRITDVDPEKEMVGERNAKALAKVQAQTALVRIEEATHNATAVAEKAKGAAAEKTAVGEADAAVIVLKGKAQAEQILAEMEAKVKAIRSIEGHEQVKSLLLAIVMGDKTLPEVAKALSGMKINWFAFPDEIKDLLGLARMIPSGGSS